MDALHFVRYLRCDGPTLWHINRGSNFNTCRLFLQSLIIICEDTRIDLYQELLTLLLILETSACWLQLQVLA